ncbi:transmembrane protein 19 [Patella vulgata]|uniref:transmembrane protein 19 n=1 Tax=Patella vulgata TaxID=6465 RepID=UPI0024A7A788|nr:transmembrane protein 19 [Patella vulgata]
MIIAVCLAIAIPITILIALTTQLYHIWNEEFEIPAPWRLIFAGLFPVIMCGWGLKRKSLNKSGALAGFVVGFVLTLANLCFFSSLIVFFVAGSKVTRFRSNKKRIQEADFKEGGQRNWIQVICNGGVATQLAVLYILETGCKEITINFSTNYSSSWLAIAVLSSLACSCGDTFASEIGSVIGTGDPWLIMSFRKVPRGTNGGVSIVGTISSLIGGLLVGVAYYIMLVLRCTDLMLLDSPAQWPIIIIGVIGGGLGSIIDSILGSTFQYSGFNKNLKRVVEHQGKDVEHITGWSLLDNHSVNLISSLLTGLISPYIALYIWQNYIS